MPMKVFAAPSRARRPTPPWRWSLEIDVNAASTSSRRTARSTSSSRSPSPPPTPRARCSRASGTRVNLTLKPDTLRAREGARLPRGVAGEPAARAAISCASPPANKTGKAGSVLYDLEVPDFYKEPFVDERRGAHVARRPREAPTVKPKDPLGDFLPGPADDDARVRRAATRWCSSPSSTRTAASAPAHMLDFKAELRAEGGASCASVTEERSSTELQGGGGYGFAARLPLDEARARALRAPRRRAVAHRRSTASSSRDIQITSRVGRTRASARSTRCARSRSDRRVRRRWSLFRRLRAQAAHAGARALQHSGAGGRRPAGGRAACAFFYARDWPPLAFDTTLQTPLQNAFFASVGFGASVLLLRARRSARAGDDGRRVGGRGAAERASAPAWRWRSASIRSWACSPAR